MSKKKMFSLITVGIVALYIICTVISFISVRQTRRSIFMSESEQIINNIYEMIPEGSKLDDIYSNKNTEDVFGEIVCDNTWVDSYPYVIAVYDENNDIVCRSGSFIRFDNPLKDGRDETVSIDEYITPEIKAQIRQYIKDNNCKEFYPSEFKYDIEDSEIIPCTLILKNRMNNNTLTLKFTSSEGEYHVIGADGEYSTNGSYCIFLDARFYNVYEDKTSEKLYNTLNDEILNKSYINTAAEDAREEYSDSGQTRYSDLKVGSGNIFCMGNDKKTDLCSVEYNGKLYIIYQSVIHNNEYDTVSSALFKELIIIQSILFAIVSVFIYIASNALYNKNKRITESKQAFTAAAAHELKTPLSVIQNQCECILDSVAPEKNEKYVQSIYDESLRMNKLVMTMLQYNRLAVSNSIEKEKCSLSEIVGKELSKYSTLIASKNICVKTDIDEYAQIECNKELLELAVDNYISNAVKYTQPAKKIDVILKKTAAGKYRLSVINEGRGIKKEYKDDLWDAFCREDKSRNSSDNSTGMGLAICKRIFELHGYKYGFNNTGNGVEFYFIT